MVITAQKMLKTLVLIVFVPYAESYFTYLICFSINEFREALQLFDRALF